MSRQLKVDLPYRPRSEAFRAGARRRALERWADPVMRARMLDGRAASAAARLSARHEARQARWFADTWRLCPLFGEA